MLIFKNKNYNFSAYIILNFFNSKLDNLNKILYFFY